MAKTSYIGANVETTDTFAQWLSRTNQMVYDMGTVVLTAASVPQPNNTNGGETSGNTHLDGVLSADIIAVPDHLRGGTVSIPATLSVTGNVEFSSATNIHVHGSVDSFQVQSPSVFTSEFIINSPTNDTNFTNNNWRVTSNILTANSAEANFNISSVSWNSNFFELGATSGGTLVVHSDAIFNRAANFNGIVSFGANTTFDGDIAKVNGILQVANTIIIGSQTNGASLQYTANVSRTYNIPNVGSDADFVLTEGNQTIGGNKSFTGTIEYSSNTTFSGNTFFTVPTRFEDTVFIDGDLVISGNSSFTSSESDIERLRVFESLEMFSGSRIVGDVVPNITGIQDLGESSARWGTLYTNSADFSGQITLGNQGTTTGNAVRADRTLRIQPGQNVTIGGAGSDAVNLTSNRTWTISAANTNLGASVSGTTVTITSSTGSDAAIGGATASLAGIVTTGNQTFAGTKTFNSTISGSINGNANTVTDGVYTSGNQTIGGNKSFTNRINIGGDLGEIGIGGRAGNYPTILLTTRTTNNGWANLYLDTDIAQSGFAIRAHSSGSSFINRFSVTLSGIGWAGSAVGDGSGIINLNASSIDSGTIAAARLPNTVVSTSGNQTIGGTKTFSNTINGSVSGNAGTVTNGVYTSGNQTIGGTKTFS
ncbi:MAG: hypothetical protein WCY93_08985, partial [Anaerolineaceae bacterium]